MSGSKSQLYLEYVCLTGLSVVAVFMAGIVMQCGCNIVKGRNLKKKDQIDIELDDDRQESINRGHEGRAPIGSEFKDAVNQAIRDIQLQRRDSDPHKLLDRAESWRLPQINLP